MSNGLTPVFIPGAWNAICDRCGGAFKNTELRKTWQGWMCCDKCWEPRQPQDFVKGTTDKMTPPWTRPRPADNFVTSGHTAVAGDAIAGVAIVDTPF